MPDRRSAPHSFRRRHRLATASLSGALLLASCAADAPFERATEPASARACPAPPSQDHRAPADYFRTLPQPPLSPDLAHAPSSAPRPIRSPDVTVPAEGTVAFISGWACDGSSERADPTASCVALEVWFRTPEGHRLDLITGVAAARVCIGEAVQRGQIVGVAAGVPGQEQWAVASRVFGPELVP